VIKSGDEVIDRDRFEYVSEVLKNHLHDKNAPVRDIYAIDCPHLVRDKKYLSSWFISSFSLGLKQARPFQDRRENILRAPIPPSELTLGESRNHVKNELERIIKSFEWNKEEDGGITPVRKCFEQFCNIISSNMFWE